MIVSAAGLESNSRVIDSVTYSLSLYCKSAPDVQTVLIGLFHSLLNIHLLFLHEDTYKGALNYYHSHAECFSCSVVFFWLGLMFVHTSLVNMLNYCRLQYRCLCCMMPYKFKGTAMPVYDIWH